VSLEIGKMKTIREFTEIHPEDPVGQDDDAGKTARKKNANRGKLRRIMQGGFNSRPYQKHGGNPGLARSIGLKQSRML